MDKKEFKRMQKMFMDEYIEQNYKKLDYTLRDLYLHFNLSAVIFFGVFFMLLYAYKNNIPYVSNEWVRLVIVIGLYVFMFGYAIKKIKIDKIAKYFFIGYIITVPMQLTYGFYVKKYLTYEGYSSLLSLSITVFLLSLLCVNSYIKQYEYEYEGINKS